MPGMGGSGGIGALQGKLGGLGMRLPGMGPPPAAPRPKVTSSVDGGSGSGSGESSTETNPTLAPSSSNRGGIGALAGKLGGMKMMLPGQAPPPRKPHVRASVAQSHLLGLIRRISLHDGPSPPKTNSTYTMT